MQPYYILSSGTLKRNEILYLLKERMGNERQFLLKMLTLSMFFGQVNLNKEFLVFLGKINLCIFITIMVTTAALFCQEIKMFPESFLCVRSSTTLTLKDAFLALAFVELCSMQSVISGEYSGAELFVAKWEEFGKTCATETCAGLMGCEGRAKEAYYQAF